MNATNGKTMTDANTDRAVYRFNSHSAAWDFVRACDLAGIPAGFPSLVGPYDVQVMISTWMMRDKCDTLAGRHPISYKFAGSDRGPILTPYVSTFPCHEISEGEPEPAVTERYVAPCPANVSYLMANSREVVWMVCDAPWQGAVLSPYAGMTSCD